MNIKYCQICGSELVFREMGDEGAVAYCMSCRKPYLDHPATCVLVASVNDVGKVVMLRQNYVSRSNWVLVAGYIKSGETLEQAVARETLEETGLKISACDYVNSYFHEGKGLLMIGFVAFTMQSSLDRRSKEVDDLRWEDLSVALSLLREGSTGQIHLNNVVNHLTEIGYGQGSKCVSP